MKQEERLAETLRKHGLDINEPQYIDIYNRVVASEVSGTITARSGTSNNIFVTEPLGGGNLEPKIMREENKQEQEFFNQAKNGAYKTIKANYSKSGGSDFFRKDGLGATGVIEKRTPDTEPLNPYEGNVARTIKAQYAKNSAANFERQDGLGATGVVSYPRIRKLTERECFRLMGVSEEDIDKIQAYRDERGKPISKSQQYKMAGNSIVVNVLAEVFANLFDKDVEHTTPTQLTLF